MTLCFVYIEIGKIVDKTRRFHQTVGGAVGIGRMIVQKPHLSFVFDGIVELHNNLCPV